MKLHLFLPITTRTFLVVAALAASAMGANDAPSADVLSNPDASARLESIKKVKAAVRTYVSKVGGPPGNSRYRLNDDDVNLLIRGLGDSSEAVRTESLRGLSLISLVGHPANGQARPGAPNLTHFPAAKEALLRTMSDSNAENRAAAARIYAAAFSVTPELENQWIAAFNMEQSDIKKQHLLIALLSSKTRSQSAVAFVLEQLKNPKLAYDTTTELLARIKPPPSEALPIMVAQFSRSADAGKRSLLARSMDLFGNDARVHLPVLQEMLAKEKDPVVKQNLALAIAKMQGNSR